MADLTFNELRKQNVSRCRRVFPECAGWSVAEWSNALAGEVGEACNITKKIIRGDEGITKEQLADELADVITYTDLLAAGQGINLEDALRRKFNIVSARRNAPEKL